MGVCLPIQLSQLDALGVDYKGVHMAFLAAILEQGNYPSVGSDHVTNEKVCADMQQEIGPHKDPLDHFEEMQTEAVWTRFPIFRSGQNRLARHSERGKKTRQTEEEVRRHQEMDRPGVHQVPESSVEQRKMEETGL